MAADADNIAKLENLLAKIRTYPDPRRAADEWKQVFKLLIAAGQPADLVSGVVGMRDLDEFAAMIEQLKNPSAAPAENRPDEETCNKAFAAFKKRFSLAVLDEESKLGRNPLTKGASSGIDGIPPPKEWPDAVWQELARQGKLRYLGRGLYGMPK